MKRIIARLDVKGENVVRGLHLEGLRVVGRPEEMAKNYAECGADEIIFIDTVASLYGRNNLTHIVERMSEQIFIPLTAGGGVRSLEDVDQLLRSGADKITINSAAVRRPELVEEIAKNYGSQCVVAAIEAKQNSSGWTAMIENARESTGLNAIEWAKELESRGAGELVVTSIDRDGTKRGFDLDLISEIVSRSRIPVIASGGAGTPEHIAEALKIADAVALGTILHFKHSTVATIKNELNHRGIEVR